MTTTPTVMKQGAYEYTTTWFFGSELRKRILEFVNPTCPIRILEIGCFEGMSACYFSDVLLDHADSTLTCVDPFDESDMITTVTKETETRFRKNIQHSRHFDKVHVFKMTSDAFFASNVHLYDFIYIDGSREPPQILKDLENSFQVLKTNGIVWMDDYMGGPENDRTIQRTIDSFVEKNKAFLNIIHVGYQFAIQKLS